MTEQIRRQISLFMDDELSAEECEFFVRRLQRDDESRSLYMRYQLIGAALRGEHINVSHDVFRDRLQSALTAGPREETTKPGRFAARSLFKVAAGVGIAASVALVSILALRGDIGFEQSESLTASAAGRRLEPVETPSYVVPLRVSEPRVVTPELRLTGLQYLMHHSGQASGLSRTVAQSNVISADSEDIIAVVEASAQ